MRDYNVYAYVALHYGKDYLPYAIKSVHNLVDRIYIFYTPHPSHGHQTDVPPIESKQDLFDSLKQLTGLFDVVSNIKITWRTTDIWNEGQQRDYAVRTLTNDGADLILVLDYDEIWHETVLDKALRHVWETNGARNWLINFSHAWRSFGYMCYDNNWPVRIIDTRHSSGTGYVPKELGDIYHFGYAVTDKVMSYKWAIHGHKDELRPNWYEDKWSVWPPPDDCHPTNGKNDEGVGWWNPEPFDRYLLPELLHSHQFFNLDLIK